MLADGAVAGNNSLMKRGDYREGVLSCLPRGGCAGCDLVGCSQYRAGTCRPSICHSPIYAGRRLGRLIYWWIRRAGDLPPNCLARMRREGFAHARHGEGSLSKSGRPALIVSAIARACAALRPSSSACARQISATSAALRLSITSPIDRDAESMEAPLIVAASSNSLMHSLSCGVMFKPHNPLL
jgi:hypothetical protein